MHRATPSMRLVKCISCDKFILRSNTNHATCRDIVRCIVPHVDDQRKRAFSELPSSLRERTDTGALKCIGASELMLSVVASSHSSFSSSQSFLSLSVPTDIPSFVTSFSRFSSTPPVTSPDLNAGSPNTTTCLSPGAYASGTAFPSVSYRLSIGAHDFVAAPIQSSDFNTQVSVAGCRPLGASTTDAISAVTLGPASHVTPSHSTASSSNLAIPTDLRSLFFIISLQIQSLSDNLNTKFDALQTTNVNDVVSVKEKCDIVLISLENRVADLKAFHRRLDELNDRVSTIDTCITSSDEVVSRLETYVSTLDTRVAALSDRMAAIEQDIHSTSVLVAACVEAVEQHPFSQLNDAQHTIASDATVPFADCDAPELLVTRIPADINLGNVKVIHLILSKLDLKHLISHVAKVIVFPRTQTRPYVDDLLSATPKIVNESLSISSVMNQSTFFSNTVAPNVHSQLHVNSKHLFSFPSTFIRNMVISARQKAKIFTVKHVFGLKLTSSITVRPVYPRAVFALLKLTETKSRAIGFKRPIVSDSTVYKRKDFNSTLIPIKSSADLAQFQESA